MKTILPTKPSHSTDRKNSRTNLTSLKPSEDCFFLSSFPVNSFFLSVLLSFFYSFFLSSFTILFLLPAFFYFFILIFLKIPSSYLSSELFFNSFFLPPFLPSIPFLFSFSFLPFFFLFLLSPFPTGETKTWSSEETRVRLC